MRDLDDSISEDCILLAEEIIERIAERLYKLKFGDSLKPPNKDQFKAAFMAETARRIKNRAEKLGV